MCSSHLCKLGGCESGADKIFGAGDKEAVKKKGKRKRRAIIRAPLPAIDN
jgi:hypothetical protein